MKTKTLQEQYNLIKEGKGDKTTFLKESKRLFPNFVRNASDYSEAKTILKQKNIISEGMLPVVGTGALSQPNWVKIFQENLNEEAKAVEEKPTEEVVDLEVKGFDYKDKENIDNMFGAEFLKGFYAEMKDEKNADKSVEDVKEIVAKNLAKDTLYYVKNGEFGTTGIGYTDQLPGMKASETDKMVPVKESVIQENTNMKKEGKLTENKMEALMELRNILDELQVLGDQARDIIAENFPSFLRKGEAYGAFDMGSSSNRYDTTLASIVADIEEYGDEEDEDMMQEDLAAKKLQENTNMKKEGKLLKEWGSSDQSIMNQSIHKDLGNPTKFPGLSQIMSAAEVAVDFYWDDWDEYKTDRDGLIISAAQRYARQYHPEFMAMASKMLEPMGETVEEEVTEESLNELTTGGDINQLAKLLDVSLETAKYIIATSGFTLPVLIAALTKGGKALIKAIKNLAKKNESVNEMKVGDKVTYLGHPAEITFVGKDTMGRDYYSVSYDKGTGRTKATNIYNKDNEIKVVEDENINEMKVCESCGKMHEGECNTLDAMVTEDSLEDQAKMYFMQKVKRGEIDTLPKDPKTAFLAQMTKDQIDHDRETLRRERGLEEAIVDTVKEDIKEGKMPSEDQLIKMKNLVEKVIEKFQVGDAKEVVEKIVELKPELEVYETYIFMLAEPLF